MVLPGKAVTARAGRQKRRERAEGQPPRRTGGGRAGQRHPPVLGPGLGKHCSTPRRTARPGGPGGFGSFGVPNTLPDGPAVAADTGAGRGRSSARRPTGRHLPIPVGGDGGHADAQEHHTRGRRGRLRRQPGHRLPALGPAPAADRAAAPRLRAAARRDRGPPGNAAGGRHRVPGLGLERAPRPCSPARPGIRG